MIKKIVVKNKTNRYAIVIVKLDIKDDNVWPRPES